VSAAQVAVRWIVQQGVIAIPKSSHVERAATNLDVFGFELTIEEMARLSALARPGGRLIDPPWAPRWDVAA
jgi:diketogulonate reductase-like aldo/keto reductase